MFLFSSRTKRVRELDELAPLNMKVCPFQVDYYEIKHNIKIISENLKLSTSEEFHQWLVQTEK